VTQASIGEQPLSALDVPDNLLRGRRAALHTVARLRWSSPSHVPAVVTIVAASVAVVVEALYFLQDLPVSIRIGTVPVSPSIVPVVVMIAAAGTNLLGRARSTDSAKVFWSMVLVVIAVISSMSDAVGPASSAGFVLAALSEELVYRVAGPLVVAFGLARFGLPYRHALTAGYVAAGISFIVLPGHLAQMDGAVDVVPFVAFTVLATLAVHRSGAVLEIGLLHSAVNIVNVGRISGSLGDEGSLLVATLLALLVIGYVPAGRRQPSAASGGLSGPPDGVNRHQNVSTGQREGEADVLLDLTGDEPAVLVDGGRLPNGGEGTTRPLQTELIN
jgi:hypothetical protein